MAKKRDIIDPKLLDELLAGRDPKTVLSSEGLLGDIQKALTERILNAEMDVHLDSPTEQEAWNHRNGNSNKTIVTGSGSIDVSIPRDRQGRFDPAIIAKYRRRLPDFDEKVIALYARGMSTRDIQGHLRELYGVEISPELVSAVTDAVLEEVTQWQNRPLEPVYALVFFDALRVKIRDEGAVKSKRVYLAIGQRCSGHKEILGLWIEHTEGAKFWLRVMNELKNRGLGDILIAVVDGLKGFPDVITAVFPLTEVQTCIVHLLRYSMHFASWKERKALAQALKPIYAAASAADAREKLREFAEGIWGKKFPMVVQSWERNWDRSFRSLPSPRRSGGSSTRRTSLKASTASCAKPCEAEVTFRAIRLRPSSSGSSCRKLRRIG
jgi:putative transposase